jgi:hypothetical protein
MRSDVLIRAEATAAERIRRVVEDAAASRILRKSNDLRANGAAY